MIAPGVNDERLALAADLARWRATIEWGTESQQFDPPDFVGQPQVDLNSDVEWQGRIQMSLNGKARLPVARYSATALVFFDAMRRMGWLRPTVRLELLVDDPHLESIPLFEGMLVGTETEGNRLELIAEVQWPWNIAQSLCRNAATLAEGIAANIKGPLWLPQIFGLARGHRLPALFEMSATKTSIAFAATDAELPLATLPDWPEAGRVQLDDEIMTYGALLNDPPRLGLLTRATPYAHSKGTRAHLLPDEAMRWIVADHAATVEVLRAGSPDGDSISGMVEEFDLGGRTATTIRLDRLPLQIEYANFTIDTSAPLAANHWEISVASTCLYPYRAFSTGESPPTGAYFSKARRFLYADWKTPLGTEQQRFDKIESLALGFEIEPRDTWGTTTRFRITVIYDQISVTRYIVAGNVLVPASKFSGTARLPDLIQKDLAGAAAATRRVLIEFDAVHESSKIAWNNTANVLAGGFESWSTREETTPTHPMALRLLLHRDQIGEDRPLARLGLFARVRADRENLVLTLRVHLAGRLLHEQRADAGTEWSTQGAWVDVANVLPEYLLDPENVFELTIDDGGELDVAALWLETELLEQTTLGDHALYGVPELIVEGVVKTTPLGIPFTLDLAEIVELGLGWQVFDPDGPRLKLEMELESPNSSFAMEVRGVTFHATVSPALSVESSDRLYADVVGRFTEVDGASNPADVIQALLGDSDFAGIESERLDGDSFAAVHALLDARGRRFQGAFQSSISLDTAIREAVAEAGCVLAPDGDRWRLSVLDDESSLGAATLIGDGDVLEYPGPLKTFPATLRASTIEMRSTNGRGLLALPKRVGGVGTETWEMRWLVAGFDSLGTLCFNRFGAPRTEIEIPLHAGWIGLLPGWNVLLNTPLCGFSSREAQCVRYRLVEGHIAVNLRLGADVETLWVGGPARLRRTLLPAGLALEVSGTIIAAFDEVGDLLLANDAVEFLSTLESSANGPRWDVENSAVLFRVDSGTESSVFSIDATGMLSVPAYISEEEILAGSVPPAGWLIDDGVLLLGTPELGIVATFDAMDGVLRLAGRLRPESL